jgi:cytochrome P450
LSTGLQHKEMLYSSCHQSRRMQLKHAVAGPPVSPIVLKTPHMPLTCYRQPPTQRNNPRIPAAADLLGQDNLLVVKDPARHAQLRALLAPAFAADAIKAYLPAIEALVARHLGDWQAAGSEGVKAHPRLKMLTFDFIMEVRVHIQASLYVCLYVLLGALPTDYS